MFKTKHWKFKKIGSKIAQSKRVLSSLQATHLTSPMRIKKKNYHREIPKQVYATAGHITALKRTRKQRLMRDETTRQASDWENTVAIETKRNNFHLINNQINALE